MSVLELLDEQIALYEELRDLTGQELKAMDSKNWVDVERIQSARLTLFNKIVFVSDGKNFKLDEKDAPGLTEQYDEKVLLLRNAADEITRMDKVLSDLAAQEIKAVEDETKALCKKRDALRGYYPVHDGAVYIDKAA